MCWREYNGVGLGLERGRGKVEGGCKMTGRGGGRVRGVRRGPVGYGE